jgi:hypothetical protein
MWDVVLPGIHLVEFGGVVAVHEVLPHLCPSGTTHIVLDNNQRTMPLNPAHHPTQSQPSYADGGLKLHSIYACLNGSISHEKHARPQSYQAQPSNMAITRGSRGQSCKPKDARLLDFFQGSTLLHTTFPSLSFSLVLRSMMGRPISPHPLL